MWAQLHVVHPCIGRLSDELWSPAPSSLLCFFLNTRHGNALVPNAASAAAAVAAAATAVSPLHSIRPPSLVLRAPTGAQPPNPPTLRRLIAHEYPQGYSVSAARRGESIANPSTPRALAGLPEGTRACCSISTPDPPSCAAREEDRYHAAAPPPPLPPRAPTCVRQSALS